MLMMLVLEPDFENHCCGLMLMNHKSRPSSLSSRNPFSCDCFPTLFSLGFLCGFLTAAGARGGLKVEWNRKERDLKKPASVLLVLQDL